jgi:hypothetical protein
MTELTLEYDGLRIMPASKIRLSSDEAMTSVPIIYEGKVKLIDPEQFWFWTDEWQAGERQVDEYIRAGNYEEFETMEEFLHTLGD